MCLQWAASPYIILFSKETYQRKEGHHHACKVKKVVFHGHIAASNSTKQSPSNLKISRPYLQESTKRGCTLQWKILEKHTLNTTPTSCTCAYSKTETLQLNTKYALKV